MEKLLKRYPALEKCKNDMLSAASACVECFVGGGKLLLCGNGGSSADCDHMAGELLKGFLLKREIADKRIPSEMSDKLQGALPAISLHSASAALTASLNDLDPNFAYAQLLYGLGKSGDALIAVSTSGNAANVCNAATLAKAMGIKVIALTGADGGRLGAIADIIIRVPESETYLVQELHLPVYHWVCAEVEKRIFG